MKKETIQPTHHGCLCCPGAEQTLSMETVLYNGFGGWAIFKNGEPFFMDESNKEWEEFETLAFIEEMAQKEPDADWRAHCDTPLHNEVYQRHGENQWHLIEQGQGFA